MKITASVLSLLAAVAPGQATTGGPMVEASLTPTVGVAVSGAAIELKLKVEVIDDGAIDATVLSGVHLQTKVAGADSGKIGESKTRDVEVAAGTKIERTLSVTLPVETTGEAKRVSVVWPGLPGAATSVLVAPEQATIDVAALDLAKTKVMLVTGDGNMTLSFLPDQAPRHVANFVKLCKLGFYDGTRFHRVIRNFMIQGGCPNTKADATGKPGTGNPGYRIDAEIGDVRHVRGVLSMARGRDLDSAGCQFFICHGDASSLDGKYSAFGMLEEGYDTLDKIAEVPVKREGNSAVPLRPVHLHKAIVLPVWK